MKSKLKFFITIIVILFLAFTLSNVLNRSLHFANDGGYEIVSISKNANISLSNVVTISDAFAVKFTDRNACLTYDIPMKDKNYDIKITNINVISSEGNKITYKLKKDSNNIKVIIYNNGFLGLDNLVINYKLNKGNDYIDENDSFILELFNPVKYNNINDFSFNITFPKIINPDNVLITYGDKKDQESIYTIINSNVITGSFKAVKDKNLCRYTLLEVFLENGYFKNVRDSKKMDIILTIFYYLITLLFFVIWFFKGKDESIAPNPTFYAPDNFTPLEIGYWIDNNVDYSDIFFMLIYWANFGYIKITRLSKEDETDNKVNYVFKKVKNLDINKPQYEKDLFDAIFNLGKQENVIDEFNTKIFRTETDALYGTLQTYAEEVGKAEEEFNEYIKEQEAESYDKDADKMFTILKTSSLILWIFSMYLFGMNNAVSLIDYMPMIVALVTVFLAFFVSKEVFFTYVIFASPILLLVSFNTIKLPILISIILDLFITAIVRKRTFKYNDILGKIYGFKNVICRSKYSLGVKQYSTQNPLYFYDVLPYALVLFSAKKWQNNFNTIENPDWYSSLDGEGLSKENINEFITQLYLLSSDILNIVNLSATADKKKEAREGMSYISKNDRIKNAGLNPEDFENDDEK